MGAGFLGGGLWKVRAEHATQPGLQQSCSLLVMCDHSCEVIQKKYNFVSMKKQSWRESHLLVMESEKKIKRSKNFLVLCQTIEVKS